MSSIVFPSAGRTRGAGPRRARTPWAITRSVVLALYLRELKTRVDGDWRGALWLVGEPLLTTALMLALYVSIRAQQVGGVDRLMFLITGLLPYQLFKSLVMRMMEAIDANKALFAYRQVRPLDALVARGAIELSVALSMAAATAIAVVLLGHALGPVQPLEWLLSSALLVAFGGSFGLLAAVGTRSDFARAAVRLAFLPLMLASGVMVPLNVVPAELRDALLLNPVLHLIDMIRGNWFGPAYRMVPGVGPIYPAAWTLITLASAMALYRLRRDTLASA